MLRPYRNVILSHFNEIVNQAILKDLERCCELKFETVRLNHHTQRYVWR